jgi:hypothetical protein
MVYQRDDGTYGCADGYKGWVADEDTILKTVFKDSQFFNLQTFQQIRANLYPEA